MSMLRISSRISAVTIYRDGAVITRIAELPAGTPGELALGGLPLCLDDDSLRVRVAGAAATVCDAHIALDTTVVDPALAPPEDADLRAATRAEAEAQAVHAALAARVALLDSVQLKPRPEAQRGAPPAPIPVHARAALLDTVAADLERLAGELAAAGDILRRASERRASLAARLAAATTARQARPEELRKSAVASLRWHGPAGDNGRLIIEYRVPGARWLPCYVVRFVPGQERADIGFRAAVRQRSGEDWSGAAVTVSSADRLAWCPLPVLPSRRIGRRQPLPASGWRAPPQGAEALYADYDQAMSGRRHLPAAGIAPPVPADEEEADGESLASSERVLGERQVEMREAPVLLSTSALGAVAAAPAPRRLSKRDMRAKAAQLKDEMRREPLAGGSVPAEQEAVRDDDPAAWLAYGALRLAGPDDGRRGRLQPAAPQTAYLALLAEAHITVSFSVLGLLRQADAAAADTAGDPPGGNWAAPDPAFPCSWTAELPATVPADGAWHVIPLLAASAAVESAFVCVPRASREVFRTAVLANPFATPLPSGPADCYLGDRFLLTAPVAALDIGGSLRLGLGVEQGLRVTRNATYHERSAGLFGGSTKAEHQVRVTLANTLQRAVRIEVRERLPVAHADDGGVTVETQRVEPPWQEWHPPDRELPGGHRWMIDLAAGSERELALDYSITFPAKQELAGGNRREA